MRARDKRPRLSASEDDTQAVKAKDEGLGGCSQMGKRQQLATTDVDGQGQRQQ